MSKFLVESDEQKADVAVNSGSSSPQFGDYRQPQKKSIFVKFLKIFSVVILFVSVIATIGGYLYWQNLKKTPQYSLALLVDAARREDQAAIDQLVDTNAVVEDFVPQITDKAIELYGRNVPPQTIARVAQVAAPIMPAIKERARAEIPALVRDKTKKFESVPFWAIALGAGKALDVAQENDRSLIKSRVQDRPLELILKRNGDRWQVVGIKDEELSRRVAEKIGQQLIVLAKNNGINKAGENFGIKNLGDLFKEVEGVFK
jgi:hypothetical protein